MDYLSGKYHSPFGAYLIPNDIKVGEKFFIEDLIENIVGAKYSRGNKARLKSAYAVWNGNDLEIIRPRIVQVYG